MTGMIDSVLTYTRAEMNTEAPRKLSLNALIDAIVANYADVGRPVKFRQAKDVVVQGGSSVFMSRQGQATLAGEREVTILGRPFALTVNPLKGAFPFRRHLLSLSMRG